MNILSQSPFLLHLEDRFLRLAVHASDQGSLGHRNRLQQSRRVKCQEAATALRAASSSIFSREILFQGAQVLYVKVIEPILNKYEVGIDAQLNRGVLLAKKAGGELASDPNVLRMAAQGAAVASQYQ